MTIGMPMIADASARVRLLFCETLLEEYEGLKQPKLDPAELESIKESIKDSKKTPNNTDITIEQEFTGLAELEVANKMKCELENLSRTLEPVNVI